MFSLCFLMAGWGFWGGMGAKTPKFVEKKRLDDIAKREQIKQKELSSRSDAALKHVIINEKRDKKARFLQYISEVLNFQFLKRCSMLTRCTTCDDIIEEQSQKRLSRMTCGEVLWGVVGEELLLHGCLVCYFHCAPFSQGVW